MYFSQIFERLRKAIMSAPKEATGGLRRFCRAQKLRHFPGLPAYVATFSLSDLPTGFRSIAYFAVKYQRMPNLGFLGFMVSRSSASSGAGAELVDRKLFAVENEGTLGSMESSSDGCASRYGPISFFQWFHHVFSANFMFFKASTPAAIAWRSRQVLPAVARA